MHPKLVLKSFSKVETNGKYYKETELISNNNLTTYYLVKQMNKKILTIIGVIIALTIIIAALLFQSFIMNNSTDAKAKADSLELHIKDLIKNYQAPPDVAVPNFYRNDSSTAFAQFKATYSNLTAVSETTFLGYLSTFMPSVALNNGLYESISIERTGNTFILVMLVSAYNVTPHQTNLTCVSYTT